MKKISEESKFKSISDYRAGKKNLEKKLLKLGLKIYFIFSMTQPFLNMYQQVVG